GFNLLGRIRQVYNKGCLPIITMTSGNNVVSSAVEAMKKGAYDFITKPFTPEGLRIAAHRVLEKRELRLENVLLRAELKDSIEDEVMIGRSVLMKKVEEVVLKVGPADSTVLICGESGTGKELVARAIHSHSNRQDKPFVVVDCGSLVENLFESELFGHIKGSFTGAIETKYGRFELANGGTLFLDEIGNISLNIQSKLLRVLQEQEITKVGSSKVVKVDVRIIAATNRDMRKETAEGTFREDLFYRLNVVPIVLPPLRDRKEDIPLLTDFFLRKYNKKRKKNIKNISKGSMQALLKYEWPGNVRELENAIERAVVLSDKDVIGPEDLLYYGLTTEKTPFAEEGKPQRLEDVEKEHIIKIFKTYKNQIGSTARVLDIDRKTLSLKLKKYGIKQK
ncbi:MAG: sigma-54-dependent Fis family transcriptional regulator, partial [Candidatus Omnitrophica bacterium]|nr:sigma-54-dependent Fis family transcriptional regulator [Candidatus Omnitrophota bacterium]